MNTSTCSIIGRDEKVSKNGCRQRQQRRPRQPLLTQTVDIDQ